MVGAGRSQFAIDFADLLVQRLDQEQARTEGAVPGLGHRQPLEENAALRTEEVPRRPTKPVRDQRLADPVLEHRAVLDQVEAEAGSLALTAHTRIGQPHLRHEVAPGELCQDLRVDAVGLARQRRQRPRPLCIGDPDIPTSKLELVMNEASAVHRLDHGDHFCIAQSMRKPRQTVEIRRDSACACERTVDPAGMPVEALVAEIKSGVHTHLRDLLGSRTR